MAVFSSNSIKKQQCFFDVIQSLRLFFRCLIFFGSINERLLKMENQNNIQARWLPSDVQYQSSLITSEAVKAKQTLDMMLVSGRRRWFLLSLKKKYAGTFSLLVWKYEISLINSIGTLEANTSLKKKTIYFSPPADQPPIIATILHTIVVRYKSVILCTFRL